MRSTQILTLWCRGRSYDEIVAELGCSRDYVRASVSRARYGGKTPGDLASERRVLARYHADPEYHRKRDAYHAEYVRANRERVNAANRARYARLKAQKIGAPLRGGAGR
jgi:hypothetical protein